MDIKNIDDKIDEWHNSESNLPLHEYLGMTKDEYVSWVKDSNLIKNNSTNHKENTDDENLVHLDVNRFFRKWYWSYDMEKYDGEHEEYSALEMIDFAEAYYKEKTDGKNSTKFDNTDLRKELIDFADAINVNDGNVDKISKLVDLYLKNK